MSKIMLLLLTVSFNCLSSSDIIGSGGAVGAGQNIVIRDTISTVLVESKFLSRRSIGDTNPGLIINFINMINRGHNDGHIDGYNDGYDE